MDIASTHRQMLALFMQTTGSYCYCNRDLLYGISLLVITGIRVAYLLTVVIRFPTDLVSVIGYHTYNELIFIWRNEL